MQRRAMGMLFVALAAALTAIAGYAFAGGSSAARLVTGVAALAVAVWLGSLSVSVFRRKR